MGARQAWVFPSPDTDLKPTRSRRPGGPIRPFVFTLEQILKNSDSSSMLSKTPFGENLGLDWVSTRPWVILGSRSGCLYVPIFGRGLGPLRERGLLS